MFASWHSLFVTKTPLFPREIPSLSARLSLRVPTKPLLARRPDCLRRRHRWLSGRNRCLAESIRVLLTFRQSPPVRRLMGDFFDGSERKVLTTVSQSLNPRASKEQLHLSMKILPPKSLIIAFALSPLMLMAQTAPTPEGQFVSPATDPRAPVAAVIDFGANQRSRPSKIGRKFEQLGINPDQVVGVTVQYPVEMAGQTIVAESLDGGRVVVHGSELTIDSEGLLSFGFQAGDASGVSRLTLYNGDTAQMLQFWVIDQSHPENGPSGN